MNVDNGVLPVEDFFAGADAVGYDGDDMIGGENCAGDNQSSGSVDSHREVAGPPDAFVPFDPRRAPNGRDLVLAMADADDEGMMDYFNQNFLKNWAGPEHWKLRKVVRRREPAFSPPGLLMNLNP
jgi:condensin complex subunit 2